VRVWDENWAKTVQSVVDQWIADYCPGATVDVNQVPWGQYWDLLRTDAASGDLPDIFNMNQSSVTYYVDNDALLDLTPYLTSAGIDPSVWGAGMVDPYRFGENRDVYGAPMEWVTVAIFYNKDMFDAAGLEYPTADWTWDDFAADAAALTKPDEGVFGAAAFTEVQAGYGSWIASAGVDPVVTVDHTACTLQEPGSVEALQFLQDLTTNGYQPSVSQLGGTSADDQYNLFKSEKVAMISAGAWKLPNAIEELGFNWDIVPFPKNPTTGESSVILHSTSWVASNTSDNPELAANLLQYLVSDEGQKFFADAGGVAPGNLNPELQQEWMNSFGESGKNIQAFVDSTTNSHGYTMYIGDDSATNDMLINIFDNGVSVEEATATACEAIQPFLTPAS
jgi:multiple sugar transport system substrate-binding protein